MSRRNFPVDVGDVVLIDGQRAELVDIPTDGPLFKLLDDEPPFDELQLEFSEIDMGRLRRDGMIKTSGDRVGGGAGTEVDEDVWECMWRCMDERRESSDGPTVEDPDPRPGDPKPENKQRVFPKQSNVEAIVRRYTPPDNYNISQPTPQAVSVQFHSPEGFDQTVQNLIRELYSFNVDQGFEVPPRLRVSSRVNPNLHPDIDDPIR